MQQYKNFRPTGFDIKGLGLEDRQDWLVAPCSTSRDADVLVQANWDSLKKCLEPFKDQWEEHSFGHWGCGHFEIILIKPDSLAAAECEEIEGSLSYYPVLDDELFSLYEWQEKAAIWGQMPSKERRVILRKAGLPVSKARNKGMPQGVEEYINLH
jgi:hypothetical protein